MVFLLVILFVGMVTTERLAWADPPFCSTPVSHSETGSLSLIGDSDKRWPNGSTLKVAMNFKGTTVRDFSYVCDASDSGRVCSNKVIKFIMEQASRWSTYGNISFQHTSNWNDAEIRIRFDRDKGANSVVGTDAQSRPRSEKTMNLDISWWNDDWIKATIIHEFGHAIGLKHEHKRPDTPYQLDEEKVYQYYSQTLGWSRKKTYHNVLRPLNFSSKSYFRTKYDDASIMRYSLRRDFVVNDDICPSDNPHYCVEPNDELSLCDIQGIWKFYPNKPVLFSCLGTPEWQRVDCGID
jgi:hypothetical protein